MSTPKAKLNSRYQNSVQQLRYETEMVPLPQQSLAPPDDAIPLLLARPAAPQSFGFRCTLHVPDFPSVVSNIFARKRDAEQDAARLALLQIGSPFFKTDSAPKPLSHQELVEALAERIGAAFSEKNIEAWFPLKEHFRAALRCKGQRHGFVPAAALSALDVKILSLCKSLDKQLEPSPAYNLVCVCEAAKRCSSVACDETGLWIKRVAPYDTEFLTRLMRSEGPEREITFQSIYIPCYLEQRVSACQMKVLSSDYFMNAIALQLGIKDASSILMSRKPITKALSEARVYWHIPSVLPSITALQTNGFCFADGSDRGSEKLNAIGNGRYEKTTIWNKRASIIAGSPIHGDAVLAHIGSSWKSGGELVSSDLSVSCFYRLILGRTPEGSYRLSRGAILIAKLPNSFSGRSQWRGCLPRSLLIEFCQQHHLPEPQFILPGFDISEDVELVTQSKYQLSNLNPFICKLKVEFRGETLEFESERIYRNRNDSVQSAALRALLYISSHVPMFEDIHIPSEMHTCLEDSSYGLKECQNSAEGIENQIHGESFANNDGEKESIKMLASGSLVCICYDVWLVGEVSAMLETDDEFEFELGTGGVIGVVEAQVSSMYVGESKQFYTSLPSMDLLLAVNGDVIDKIDEAKLGRCSLRYNVKVLRSVEPPEERMESALFSPPLSKQRNDFVIDHIKETHAKSLLDLGCGSGSLLDAVFDHSTELEQIAGVDVSLKSLFRAAKSLHGKIVSAENNVRSTAGNLKEAVLYEGSISEVDYRLCGYDLAVCIEVIEHMDPEPLSKFGQVVLGALSPCMLIVSTPNVEYNPILQKMTAEVKKLQYDGIPESLPCSDMVKGENREVETIHSVVSNLDEVQNIVLFGDESGIQPYKFRNDDHRFEWTRAEFKTWAEDLASEFGYAVKFTGVGGSKNDPGFASQIALFTRLSNTCEENFKRAASDVYDSVCSQNGIGAEETHPHHPYKKVWNYKQEIKD